MKYYLALAASILLQTCSVVWAGAPYEATVSQIDKFAFALDKRLDEFTKTSDDHCDEDEVCTRTVAYWDRRGRIQKTVQELRQPAGPGTVTGRYFSNCHVVLVRVTPNDTEAVKNPRTIEKFYFHKDKLLRVVFGDETQPFSKDQMAYYERAHRGDAKTCQRTPEK